MRVVLGRTHCAPRAGQVSGLQPTDDDIAACDALCVRVHGHDRHGELVDAVKQGTATLVEQGGRVVGYASSVGYLGHAVAEHNDGLKALIGAAPSFFGPGFILPTDNGDVLRWCLSHGLRTEQEIRHGLDGNFCRCTGYQHIINAVQHAANKA